jgi:uncharacterized membrane-anchored protein YhcB (DUF1043 family)
MNFMELAAGVIGNLLVAGIVVGFVIVAVLPRQRGRADMSGDDWRELPPPRDDDWRPPRWPQG